MTMAARVAAALTAMAALGGLGIQFAATLAQTGAVSETLWILLRFFTILTNIAVAVTFAAIAAARPPTPRFTAGVVLAILLVGIIYGLLLRGLLSLSGGALLADTLLHKVTPVLAAIWWTGFAPKGHLDWRAPWLWALYPAAYLPYALLRGMAEGKYAYPFVDLNTLGWGQVLTNSVMIAIGFLIAGHALVCIDRRFRAG